MISTRRLTHLPDCADLQRLLQAMAMLDAILEEEWDMRYYSFNAKWGAGEQMGSMRNGSGDDFFALFNVAGCFLRGFDHESVMSPWASENRAVWPGVLDSVPEEFSAAIKEPAFHMQDTTFCIWRRNGEPAWSRGQIDFPDADDPDGSEAMLSDLDGLPETYQAFASEYYEIDLPLGAVARIYAHEPLTEGLLREFPTTRSIEDLRSDAEEIGYPVG
jgi:hypothetical protein